jgi:RimJ/RimL family protein N-acetyltransferase
MERVGFQLEGILRQHELHNGSRRDMHVFGMLKSEFYERYETLFKLP